MLLACLPQMKAQSSLFYGGNYLSSTMITSICQDKAGYIWVGTEYGLNRFDGYRFTVYKNNPQDSTSLMFNIVNSVFCDSEGNLWVGTNIGLQRYDYASDSFIRYAFSNSQRPRVNAICELPDGKVLVGTSGFGIHRVQKDSLKLDFLPDYQYDENDSYFEYLYVDSKGRLWKGGAGGIGVKAPGEKPQMFFPDSETPTAFSEIDGKVLILTREKIHVYDNGKMKDHWFDLSEVPSSVPGFNTVLKDLKGNLYLGTRGNGLFWIPVGSSKVLRYPFSAVGLNAATAKIWSLYEDRQRNVWVGCQRKGLLAIPNRKAQFSSWSFSEQKRDIGSYVSSVTKGANGIVWCTVQNDGVYGFDETGRVVAHPAAPGGVEFIDRDRNDNYYLGTGQAVYTYNPTTGSANKLFDFVCGKLNCMADDGRGHLFFSVFGRGLVKYDQATRQIQHFKMSDSDDAVRGRLWNDWVMTMTTDRMGRVWIATSWGVCCYDPTADSFKPFGWSAICERMRCEALCETHDGDILVGTMEGLFVWRRNTNTVEEYPGAESLKGNTIACIVQDNEGGIWCATSAGIWFCRPTDKEWVNYAGGAGLSVKEYISSAGMFSAADDRIYFATNDGITTFTPQQVQSVMSKPGKVYLSNLFISNQRVNTLTESGGRRVTEMPVIESDHFTLSYLESSIVLELTLFDYTEVSTAFEYRLNDADTWTRNAKGQNTIVFSHLSSGTYKLEVRAVDNGIVSEPRLFTIVVTPPWYRTTIAYLVYLLGLVGLSVFLAFTYRRRMSQRFEEDKMKFLINATHDIRSPLTLIKGPLEKLRKRELDPESQADLSVIEHNSQRILSLVNQILDVRKIDKQQMHLHCSETDMVDFVQTIYKIYEYNAKERQINFTFTVDKDALDDSRKLMVWIDRVQFDKVVSNLLSNAFKYSFDHGDIEIVLTKGHDDKVKTPLADYMQLTFTDNGTGMRDETLQHIFDRFYQGKNDKSAHVEGTGIGLNLCKMIVDMHHGSISGNNRTDGVKGSVFTVRLPLGNSHFSEEELDTTTVRPGSMRLMGAKQPNSGYHLLVVDDDEEMARYIANELGDHYYFTTSPNGKEGLKELLMRRYDLVISDVMMPVMDGFTMLHMIRANSMIAHLPVIMLTSKGDIGNRLQGLEKGADAYLTKPFSIDELHATIDNLIAGRLLLRGKYSGKHQPSEIHLKEPEEKGPDEKLMDRVIKSVNEHLSDYTFNVEILCEEVGVSRAHLHRKMKQLTGFSVSQFIRNVRLEQAARLLKEQKFTVTRVADITGFSSLTYFSSLFKQHFGVAPSEYADLENEKTENGENSSEETEN